MKIKDLFEKNFIIQLENTLYADLYWYIVDAPPGSSECMQMKIIEDILDALEFNATIKLYKVLCTNLLQLYHIQIPSTLDKQILFRLHTNI